MRDAPKTYGLAALSTKAGIRFMDLFGSTLARRIVAPAAVIFLVMLAATQSLLTSQTAAILFLLYSLQRLVLTPARAIRHAIHRYSAGDKTSRVAGGFKGEIGALADQLNSLIDAAGESERQSELQHKALAEAKTATDEALRHEAGRAHQMKAILDTVIDGIITIDDRGIVEGFNPAAERLFGYGASEVIGKNVSILMPLSHGQQHDRYLADYQRTGAAKIIGIGREIEARRKDGSLFAAELGVSPFEVDGKRKFVGSVRDITRRKQAMRREAERSRQMQAILDTVVDGIITISESGIVESLNPSAERIFGYSREEVIGKNVNMLMPEPYHSGHDGYLRNHITTGEKKVIGQGREVSARRKDGRLFPIELAVGAFESGGRTMFVGSVRDISEKKRLAFELNGQIEAINKVQAVIEFDAEGTILDANENFLDMTGYRFEEIRGRHHSIFIEPSHLVSDEYRRFWDSLRQGQSQTAEYKRLGKDGNIIWMAGCYAPRFNENGALSKIVKFATDITKRKQAEMLLAEQSRELQAKNSELQNATEAADNANRMKSDFLATMSHEIRTPMNGIIGMTELLIDSGLPPAQHDQARTVMSSAESLLTIINDILDFSKIEAGKLAFENIPFDLRSMIEDTAELMAVKAREKTIELVVRYVPGTSSAVIGDPTRVRQVVSNLVTNAIKFTESGHVLVTVEEMAKKEGSEPKAIIKVSVRDTGIGISEEAQNRLFEKFSQLDASTTRKYGGTGLGLAICKQLVAMMKGELGLSSVVGEGSEFWFTCELGIAESGAPEAREARIEHLRGVRVLVVDDIEANCILVKEQLENLGATCDSCADGGRVLARLQRAKADGKPYHIVVLDYLLPGKNGEAIARLIKGDDALKDTALIMSASASGHGYTRRFADAGISACLAKPIHGKQLVETVGEVWRAYERGDTRNGLISVQNIRTRVNPQEGLRFDGARILVAEDNRVNQTFITEVLEGFGCSVAVASNGKEAVDHLSAMGADLVLMDCKMPVMDGFEASRIIADLKIKGLVPKTPIVALTANALKGDRERCIAAGMDDYIAKPIRKSDLAKALASLLPATLVQRPAAQTRAYDESGGPAKLFDKAQILVVEDNRVNREFAVELLEAMGCLVTTAENGKVALQRVGAAQFDAVLMDIQMPEMDGYEATRRIRDMSDWNEIHRVPIIALTANALKGDADKCLEAGMDDYLSKPVHRRDLSAKLLKWIDPSKRRQDGEDATVLPSKGRILVAANDRTHRERVLEILQAFGFEVSIADNGQRAIETVRGSTYDLVLMDCEMPKTDGWDAARAIDAMRRRKEIPDVPVIAMTAFEAPGIAERCFAAGMDGYLAKTVWDEKWKPQISKLLDRWLARSGTEAAGEQEVTAVNPRTLLEVRKMMRQKFDAYIRLYIEDTQAQIEKLQQFGETGSSLSELVIAAHSLKSSSRQIGAARLSQAAAKLEECANLIAVDGRNAESIAALAAQLPGLFRDVKTQLETQIMSERAA